MLRNIQLLIVLIFMMGLMSCSKNVIESKATQATIAVRLGTNATQLSKASTPSFSFTDLGGTTFTITEARINVRHIQFDYPEGNSDNFNQISLNGPFLIDLITGTSNPEIGAFDVEPGIYKRIDVRLDDAEADDGLVSGNDDLLDNTLVVKGSFDYDGNTNRNFTFILKFNEDIRFEEPGGISINEGETKDIILNLKVDEWLSNINITECLDDGDIVLEGSGDLIINDNNNNDCNNFEGTIKANIKNNYDFD